jgi:SAM-dependent methyltransferase
MTEKFRNWKSRNEKRKKFAAQFRQFCESAGSKGAHFNIPTAPHIPFLDDATGVTHFDRHYVYHIAWACRVVKEINPEVHVDFSSSLHFCTALSAFIPVEFYDYRPAQLGLDNLKSLHGDLTAIQLPDNSVQSLSCMHTVEHVGLGRYGDPIDFYGDVKAIAELKRITAPGGSLLFVVPVGQQRIEFNGQRIYAFETVMKQFDGLELREFSLIPDHADAGGLIRNCDPKLVAAQKNGCGCFHFVKKKVSGA